MATKNQEKKIKLGKKGRQTKWAPIWAVLKKYGKGAHGEGQSSR
jgi:ribosomal protein L39E